MMRIWRLLWLGLGVLAMLAAHAGDGPADFQGPKTFTLAGASSSGLLVSQYPCRDLRLEFTLKFTKPGVIFDTVGINGAPIGSWAVSVDGNGVLHVQIYDPGRKSPLQVANGWHILPCSYGIITGSTQHVTVQVAGGIVSLQLGAMPADTLALATPLSGNPVYVGDFPGDDTWGPRYNIHPAMTGTVTVTYLGPHVKPATNTTTTGTTNTGKPPVDTSARPTEKPVPTDAPAAVDAGVAKIEQALRAGDVAKAIALTTPDARDTLGAMFRAHAAELPRLADLLATRKLTVVSGSYAEYEVTDGHRTFTVIFYQIQGAWRLASL